MPHWFTVAVVLRTKETVAVTLAAPSLFLDAVGGVGRADSILFLRNPLPGQRHAIFQNHFIHSA
jgi:hypothetical protein